MGREVGVGGHQRGVGDIFLIVNTSRTKLAVTQLD